MIVEYTRYKIEPARRESFESDYRTGVQALGDSVHCLAYELSRSSEDPGQYVLRIEWDSAKGHLEGFRSSGEFHRFFAAIQSYVKDIQEMRHYDVLVAARRTV